MKTISFGQFYPADSILHRMDPRMKIVVAILYIVCTFLCKGILSFAVLLFATVTLILASKVPLKIILRSIRPLVILIAFTSIINIFMSKGEHLLTPESWKIHIYAEGVWNAVFMVLRLVILITSTGLFLTYTTTPIVLTDAIESLLSPLKKLHVPVHDMAMMMSIALRFIPLLSDETERIMNAQKARGNDFSRGGLVKRAKAMIPIIIPLIASAIDRALELAAAMECRCYHGGVGRTKLKVMHLRVSDFVLFFATILLGAGLIFLNQTGIGYTMR